MKEKNSLSMNPKLDSIRKISMRSIDIGDQLESKRKISVNKVEELVKTNLDSSFIPGQKSALENKKKTIDRLNANKMISSKRNTASIPKL